MWRAFRSSAHCGGTMTGPSGGSLSPTSEIRLSAADPTLDVMMHGDVDQLVEGGVLAASACGTDNCHRLTFGRAARYFPADGRMF